MLKTYVVLSFALVASACGSSTKTPDSTGDVGSDASVEDMHSNNGIRDVGGTPDHGVIDVGLPPADMGFADAGTDMPGEVDMGPDFGPLDDRPSSERHVKVPLGTTTAGNGYWEYLPPTYERGAPSPLLIFWHGIGENGDGSESALNQVANNGPPRYIARDEWPNDRPFVVLSPQHAGGGCPGANEIRDFIDYAMAEYDVDENRIYMTGLSCGAIGSWNYLGQHIATTPLAAAVLIAGNGVNPVNNTGCQIAQLPLWGFHGDADPTVNVNGTRGAMETLMACPDPKADLKLTIYEGVGHNSWSRTYDGSAGHDIYSWMLSQQRQ